MFAQLQILSNHASHCENRIRTERVGCLGFVMCLSDVMYLGGVRCLDDVRYLIMELSFNLNYY